MAGAIVTLVHGAQQTERWNKFCRDGWQAYAKKHGLELLVLDQPIDASERGKARSPTWHKLLLGRAPVPKRYEQVAWIDPDVLINSAKAPNLFEHVLGELAGAHGRSVEVASDTH